MRLWRRLTGRETTEEREERVRALLRAAAANPDPRRSLRRLDRIGRSATDLVGFGGDHHETFRRAVVSAWRRGEPNRLHRDLPTVAATLWSRWPSPTVSELTIWAREEDAGALAVFDQGGVARSDGLLQLNALRLLADDDRLVVVVAGEGDVFLRRRFLLQVGSAARLDVEEVIQELRDAAGVLGYRVRTL